MISRLRKKFVRRLKSTIDGYSGERVLCLLLAYVIKYCRLFNSIKLIK